MLCVGMPFGTIGVRENTIVPMLRVGMPFRTLCVLLRCRASRREGTDMSNRAIAVGQSLPLAFQPA
ncbi:hypothetical protein AMC94_08895 [Pseudomonas amygdali pv. aesculi]|nr:hypothetical protein AL041_14640 [Pseudomonas amygdali pv. aesculi]KWT23022.1 hypothetical protein AL042_21665 [Pseudomonas amygdali pv. aesculi]KWT25307.1 hypothetical protein AL043_02030 [Pseudomonas amygdali pv. aesculi]KWT32312.1 hypothetical protein AL044_09535 [Pseudomonas amygdali pv. aesculi]KWT39099.1 hypothetical protein AL045_18690 [Pseudomonas amygdali pv. aesculi]